MDTPALPVPTKPPSRQTLGFLASTGACALTTGITWPFHTVLDPVNTVMLFLLTVVLVEIWLQRGAQHPGGTVTVEPSELVAQRHEHNLFCGPLYGC